MWVTQTYLGNVEPDANVFVYYLYEDYIPEQKTFTQEVQHELERLGDVYNKDVSLLMPNPKYADRIEGEVRKIEELWELVSGALPGLLILKVPLVKLKDIYEDCYYIPFDLKLDKLVVIDTIKKARSLIDKELLQIRPAHRDYVMKTIYRKLGEAIEIKPGMFGFRIDLKKLFS